MSYDIVTRLRVSSNWLDASYYTDVRNEIREAADEIERLRARIAELERAACQEAKQKENSDE